jgi:hypothetical protein
MFGTSRGTEFWRRFDAVETTQMSESLVPGNATRWHRPRVSFPLARHSPSSRFLQRQEKHLVLLCRQNGTSLSTYLRRGEFLAVDLDVLPAAGAMQVKLLAREMSPVPEYSANCG